MNATKILTKNAAYQKFVVLKTNRNKRFKYGEFLVEGVRNLNEAVQNGWKVRSLLYPADTQLSGWARGMLERTPTEQNFELRGELMAELSGKTDTSELMAVIAMRTREPDELPLSDHPLLALFDRPSNRGNLGTVLRSCDAVGVEALVSAGHAVDFYDPETVAATMGSFFQVPFASIPDNAGVLRFIDGLRRSRPGFRVVGTSAHAKAPIFETDLTGPVLLLIGNETDGLSRFCYDICDCTATIPMAAGSSASSFNAACAATVLFYEAARQRAAADRLPGAKTEAAR